MDHPSKALLISLGVGVGVAVVVAGGVYYVVNENKARKSAASSAPVAIERRIANEHAGIVIGRGGESVREIKRKTETRIVFKAELTTATHRVLEIRGNADDVNLAQILIDQTIANQPKVEKVEINIPNSATGRVIGMGGENLRVMQTSSKCRIHVDRDGADADGRRKVILRGTTEQVEVAKRLIENKVAEGKDLDKRIKSSVVENRQIKHKQPLFLRSEDTEALEPALAKGRESYYEQLQMSAGDTALPIFVSSVKDPGMFYVQKVGPGSVKLDKLVKEMTDYYESNVNRQLSGISQETCAVGDLVAAKSAYDDKWYRGKVVDIVKDDYDESTEPELELDFVDFGDAERKKLSEVCDLKTEFLALNFQAIECAMADIEPPGQTWTPEASEAFEFVTRCSEWKELLAEIKEQRRVGERLVPMLTLMDPTGSMDVDIAEEMVRLGHAAFTKASLRRPGEKKKKFSS